MLNPSEIYTRQKHILYDSKGISILKFIEKAVDAENLTGKLVENMNNYIRCYPERVEIIKQKTNNQLTFF